MWYRKNVGGRERWGRLLAGGAMVVCGLVGLEASLPGLVLSGAGIVALLTGMVGYCPACAVAGRKPLAER